MTRSRRVTNWSKHRNWKQINAAQKEYLREYHRASLAATEKHL